ncbi:DUF3324 domain-containing protein [Chryseobacterium nematophagum]|uniref:DUF3324 domain-containing protein n=1 Tax=Chryseobacterium nematophagum TaxID=2305228 RepID=A0A3M7TKL1_9FLAO|nr:DUF916 domain-containing protein [Chryseobacterium nematophagum]RNA63684.1 DUF3324 domain-containing protein [Chryseobacterium nematophagum]
MIKRIFLFIFLLSHITFLYASITILNGLTHTYKVEKGTLYKGKIEIENTGKKTQNVKLFLQDFSYQSNGTISYTTPHTNNKTNVDWITLNTNQLTLKAKEKKEVYYEITIPNNILEPGSYWSVIMVEPVEDIKPNDNKEGVNITSIVRYAIQIITDYDAEKAKPNLIFESIKIDKVEGKQTANIAVANKGNLYCKPSVTIEIYNRKTAEKVGVFSSQPMGLLPQTSKTFQINIDKLVPDKYNAIILSTDENENAFALNVELDLKND